MRKTISVRVFIFFIRIVSGQRKAHDGPCEE
jgi:hypothetical protein